MANGPQSKLSRQDQEVIELLEEAKRLYEEYRSINDLPVSTSTPDEPLSPVPTWDTPLTLVVKTSIK